jgi:hypothetical protein
VSTIDAIWTSLHRERILLGCSTVGAFAAVREKA